MRLQRRNKNLCFDFYKILLKLRIKSKLIKYIHLLLRNNHDLEVIFTQRGFLQIKLMLLFNNCDINLFKMSNKDEIELMETPGTSYYDEPSLQKNTFQSGFI